MAAVAIDLAVGRVVRRYEWNAAAEVGGSAGRNARGAGAAACALHLPAIHAGLRVLREITHRYGRGMLALSLNLRRLVPPRRACTIRLYHIPTAPPAARVDRDPH